MERRDSEIHSFSHWAIMTRAMERTDSEIHPFSLWTIMTRVMKRTGWDTSILPLSSHDWPFCDTVIALQQLTLTYQLSYFAYSGAGSTADIDIPTEPLWAMRAAIPFSIVAPFLKASRKASSPSSATTQAAPHNGKTIRDIWAWRNGLLTQCYRALGFGVWGLGFGVWPQESHKHENHTKSTKDLHKSSQSCLLIRSPDVTNHKPSMREPRIIAWYWGWLWSNTLNTALGHLPSAAEKKHSLIKRISENKILDPWSLKLCKSQTIAVTILLPFPHVIHSLFIFTDIYVRRQHGGIVS